MEVTVIDLITEDMARVLGVRKPEPQLNKNGHIFVSLTLRNTYSAKQRRAWRPWVDRILREI